MLFNSLDFLIFFPMVLLVYFIIPRKVRYIWLLVASYYFYMCWNAKYALLLLFSTAITYLSSMLMYKLDQRIFLKRMIAGFCIILNFGILFVFKYLDFALDTLNITLPVERFNLLLPVGISFYIFQAVGYMVDVYRGGIEPEKNFLRYALFVSFFPQLVAGPIERSKNLIPQLKRVADIKLWDMSRIRDGALIMLYGYFLKMIISDRAALYVDTVFDVSSYSMYAGVTTIVAAVLFSIQVYCDFAGYTYIAIGAARIMGFYLMNNFDTPYLAVSIKDFWNRWHISLTTWFRDYLYYPLGGSRKGKVRKYVNILIVFGVSGLWHGAAWHYVVWGMLHGVLRVVGEVTRRIRENSLKLCRVKTDTLAFHALRVTLTFAMVTIAWVFFRAASIKQALDIIVSMFRKWNPWVWFDGSLYTLGLDEKDWKVLLVSVSILFLIECFKYKKMDLVTVFGKQNILFQWLFFYVGILAVIVFGIYGAGYNANQFIYFQF